MSCVDKTEIRFTACKQIKSAGVAFFDMLMANWQLRRAELS